MFSDTLFFWQAFLGDPRRVAALAPSSASLARLITSEIDRSRAPVLELGPGTGIFTRALIERGVPETRLVLVEAGGEFVDRLALQFPAATVLCMDAARLAALGPGFRPGAVVSGLPLLSMSPRKVTAILDGAFALLAPGAAFYQFTYSWRCPVPRRVLDRLGLKAMKIGAAYANLPPASVYRITRRPVRRAPSPVPLILDARPLEPGDAA